MAYGIMRIEKRGRGAVYGLQIEANRKPEDKDKRDFARSDIDWNKTSQNENFVRTENWNQEITRQIKAAGVREVMKGKNASIVLLDGVYTASAEWFDTHSREEAEQYFRDCLQFHVREYCGGDESRLINAVVHWDETTPHMQVASVPLIEDEKGWHLSAKKIMGSQSDYRHRQDLFYEQVSRVRGMDRGELVGHEIGEDGLRHRAEDAKAHTTKREWQLAEQEERQRALDRERSEAEDARDAARRDLSKARHDEERARDRVEELETDRTILSAAQVSGIDSNTKSPAFHKDEVIIPRTDYTALIQTAQAAEEARKIARKQARQMKAAQMAQQKAEAAEQAANECERQASAVVDRAARCDRAEAGLQDAQRQVASLQDQVREQARRLSLLDWMKKAVPDLLHRLERVCRMEDLWDKPWEDHYFAAGKFEGCEWDGKLLRRGEFADRYLQECKEASVSPRKDISQRAYHRERSKYNKHDDDLSL